MNKPIAILFRVDAYEKLGLGHLSRCRSLMLAFLHYADCKLSVISNDEIVVKEFISNIDFDFYNSRDSLQSKFDIVVIDVPDIAVKKNDNFIGVSDCLVCIDDEGNGLDYQDILIRPNLLNLPKTSALKISQENYWSGRNYIILHPDFNKQFGKSSKVVKELLICFGGSDPCRLTLRVLPLLRKLEDNINFHVVIGPAFTGKNEVFSLVDNDRRFTISCNVPNMAQNFSKADIALISGGTMLYEACAMGTPAIVICQNEPQETEAKICQAAGAVISLGVNKFVSDDTMLKAIKEIVADYTLRVNMAKMGPNIVSHDGAANIALKLLNYAGKEVRK